MRSLPEHGIAFSDAFRVWVRIALLSFGGPAGQIAVMHRILVDEKRWIGESRFLHALNFCMLLPGPEAQQLATYIGWLLHGVRGGLAAGLLFILPGFVAILGLSFLYVLLGGNSLVAGLFFGLKAAVLAIVVQALLRLAGRALHNLTLRVLAGVAFVAIFFFNAPFPLIVFGAGVLGLLGARLGVAALRTGTASHPGARTALADADSALGESLPAHARVHWGWALRIGLILGVLWLGPVLALWIGLGHEHVFTRIGVFFSQAAVVTFGGAYAVLAYVAQAAVENFGWLQPGEMLDGLGMAESTPGPLIMVLQFVGFMGAWRDPGTLPPLLAASLGAGLAIWVTFTPCFLWIFVGAPFVERLRRNHAISAALTAITAAVVGVILNLALWFAIHTLFARTRSWSWGLLSLQLPDPASIQPPAVLLATFALLAVLRFRLGLFTLLGSCAGLGIGYRLLF